MFKPIYTELFHVLFLKSIIMIQFAKQVIWHLPDLTLVCFCQPDIVYYFRLGSGKPTNLILDDGKDSDEDETFVVEDTAPPSPKHDQVFG